jgi:adenylate cyclase
LRAKRKGPRRLRIQSGPRLRAVLFGLVTLVSAAAAITAFATNALRTQDLSTVDARFSIRGAQRPPSNIVIVKIDDVTFDELNIEWPFPRATHARVINRIAAQHPAAIVYDVQFSEPSTGAAKASQSDEVAMLSAINNAHGRTVFSTTETSASGNFKFLGSTAGAKLLNEVGSRAGNGLLPGQSSDVVIRQMDYSIGHLQTLAVAGAEVATGRHVSAGEFGGGHDWIDYQGLRMCSGVLPA